jgi:drug/metabolite transporter (DMT)-like permease
MTTNRRAYAAWAVVCIVWGTTYLAIRIGLETMPPLVMAGSRYVIAGVILAVVLKVRGERLPPPAAWPSLFVLGTLLLGLGNGGVVWAEQTLPSGFTALLVATVPFWLTGIDALLPRGERMTRLHALGLLVGLCGIVTLVWPDLRAGANRGFLAGAAAAQIACIGWTAGSLYAKRRGHGAAKDENVLATAAFEMLFGGIALLMAGTALGELHGVTLTARTTGAFLYLIFFGAVLGFAAYAYALKHLPVAIVSLYAYVNPLIAVLLGTLLLDEPFDSRILAGALIVFAGMALVRTGRPARDLEELQEPV